MPVTTAPGPFGYRYLVGHSDIDDGGVVHFSRYPALVETAVLRGLAALGSGLSQLRGSGGQLVVSQLQARYQAPARLLDELEITAWPEQVGGVQCRMSGTVALVRPDAGEASSRPVGTARLPSGGEEPVPLARIELVLAVLDAETNRPVRLPEPMRTALTELAGGGHRCEGIRT